MGSRVFLILLFTSINAALIDDDNFFIAEKMDLGWFKAVVTYNSVSLRMNCIAVLAIEMNHNASFNAARFSAEERMGWIGNVDGTLIEVGAEGIIFMTLEGRRMAEETPRPDLPPVSK